MSGDISGALLMRRCGAIFGFDSVMSKGFDGREGVESHRRIQMKAHELLSSPDTWCQESPAEDGQGNKVQALDPNAVKWCALAAVQKTYPPSQWEEMMDRVLRALSVSEKGIAQLTKSDKACCLMEWNDDRSYSFQDIREVLIEADV